MNYVPAWLFCIPNDDEENYFEWLLTEAPNNGVPEHVRINLIRRYAERLKRQIRDGV